MGRRLTLVVDASVAVKWMVREPGNDAARSPLDLPDPLIAPNWLLIEAASTFWKKVKAGELLELHAERHLGDLPRFFSRLHDGEQLVGAALSYSFRLRHSVYDCLYLALAEQENCQIATADGEFVAALKRGGLEARAMLLEY